MNTTNLTDSVDIRHAIQKKGGGHGALTTLAKDLDILPSALSMNINGTRSQEYILEGIANFLGQSVHGVHPVGSEKAA